MVGFAPQRKESPFRTFKPQEHVQVGRSLRRGAKWAAE
jgi:hypothetical protein